MNEQAAFETYQGIVAPAPIQVKPVKQNRYGSVPGLADEELAEPDELERQIFIEEFGPILALPIRKGDRGPRPELDEDGFVVGAFATIDFDRIKSKIDKASYRADKLREELKNVLIMISIVKEHLPGRAKYLVLKYLNMGLINMEHISDSEMRSLAKLYMKAKNIQKQISELDKVRQRRMARIRAEMFG